jgi:uncharacterized protein
MRNGDWIQLHNGAPFWPLDPRPEEIDIETIAHALSMLCRFGGHATRFYSVAEHSVYVSRMVPPVDALWALLHDATEAYLVDLPRPIKGMLPGYKAAEDRLMGVIAERFGLTQDMPVSVKDADWRMLFTERDQVMHPSLIPWETKGKPYDLTITGLPPEAARVAFLTRFEDLTRGDL